jgi:hypothetical protein
LGCDGEHVTGLHALLGEADAAVNLVGGEGGESAGVREGERSCQDEWAEEDPWNDISEEGESEELTYSHAYQDTIPHADVAETGEWEYESLWVGTVSVVDTPEGANGITRATTSQGSDQESDQDGAEEEATEDEDMQWDQETSPAGRAASVPRRPGGRPARRPTGGRVQKPHPRRRTPSRPGQGARSERTEDQQWEEARHNAWLRQLLSDDSSDESDEEERYGRFAESGRWISELYGIPQYPTTTLRRECSA